MSDKTYCYPPDYKVLKNKYGLHNADILDKAERRASRARLEQHLPLGEFDKTHLQAIHHHLFQDVYEWAGEFRTLNISKGNSNFIDVSRLDLAMQDIHKRLANRDYLKDLSHAEFAKGAAEIIGDLNYAHPFRDGNGRTQLSYLILLAEQARHVFMPERLDKKAWIEASIATCKPDPDYKPMSKCITQGLAPLRTRIDERGIKKLREKYRTQKTPNRGREPER